jgi:hypothetical protein
MWCAKTRLQRGPLRLPPAIGPSEPAQRTSPAAQPIRPGTRETTDATLLVLPYYDMIALGWARYRDRISINSAAARQAAPSGSPGIRHLCRRRSSPSDLLHHQLLPWRPPALRLPRHQ